MSSVANFVSARLCNFYQAHNRAVVGRFVVRPIATEEYLLGSQLCRRRFGPSSWEERAQYEEENWFIKSFFDGTLLISPDWHYATTYPARQSVKGVIARYFDPIDVIGDTQVFKRKPLNTFVGDAENTFSTFLKQKYLTNVIAV